MNELLQAMVRFASTQPVSADSVRFASNDEADSLVKRDLFAFLMACCIDRVGRSDDLWNIPWLLQQEWGQLDPGAISAMDPLSLAESPALKSAPTQAGALNTARTIVSLARMVHEKLGGDSSRVFEGDVYDIIDRLTSVFGVGENIARMVVIQRMRYFGFVPEPGGVLLPKMDTHLQRVFRRARLVSNATENQFRRVLKGCSADDVAAIDQACWSIGRKWCRPTDPDCGECPLGALCPRLTEA